MVLSLIQNIAILVALSVVTQAVTRRSEPGSRRRALLLGVLFGATAVLGMMTPFKAAEGIIYDGRSIVLGIAGLFGGPGAAALAATMAAAFRLHLGGAGAPAGVATILSSAALGVALFYHRRMTGHLLWRELLALGIAIHAVMLACQALLLPAGRGLEIAPRIALPVLTVYPVGFLLVARLMLDEEERHRYVEELRALNTSLELLVDERTEELQATNEELEQTNEELARALAEIEAASQSKSAFLRVMSHELRTPLNTVIGFADLLRSGLAGPLTEEQAKQIGMIRDAGQHLLDLVNQTLDLARIEAGRLELVFEHLDARNLAATVTESLRPEAETKGLSLTAVLPDEQASLCTDPMRTREILTNLVANAVKFTDAGSVTVTVSQDDDRIRFSVSDTGPGIAPEDASRIFLEFVQASGPDHARTSPGAGLGLAISKRLAEAMGGTLELVSELGRGSTFTLTLPVQPQSAAGRQR